MLNMKYNGPYINETNSFEFEKILKNLYIGYSDLLSELQDGFPVQIYWENIKYGFTYWSKEELDEAIFKIKYNLETFNLNDGGKNVANELSISEINDWQYEITKDHIGNVPVIFDEELEALEKIEKLETFTEKQLEIRAAIKRKIRYRNQRERKCFMENKNNNIEVAQDTVSDIISALEELRNQIGTGDFVKCVDKAKGFETAATELRKAIEQLAK